MASNARLPPHIRHASLAGNSGGSNSTSSNPSSSASASPALLARIAEKKAELSNLRELRDLSGQLAGQMQMLEEKLSTLAGGTEAVAMVLSNWHNVLRAINMASMKIPKSKEDGTSGEPDNADTDTSLPQTLVRIPVQGAATSEPAGAG